MADDPRRGRKKGGGGWQRGVTLLTERMTLFQTRMTLFRDRAAVIREKVWRARLHTLMGLGIGLALVLFVLVLELLGGLDRLELMALDFRFWLRGSCTESPLIVHVDMDDNTFVALGHKNPNRSHQAPVLRALGKMGARLVVYDIEYDTFSGDPADFELQKAFHESEKLYGARVIIAHRFDVQNPLPPDVEAIYPKVRSALLENLRLDPDRPEGRKHLIDQLGLTKKIIDDDFVKMRTRVVNDEVMALYNASIASGTAVSLEAIRDRLLPHYNENFDLGLLELLASALRRAESITNIRSRLPQTVYRFAGKGGLQPQDAAPLSVELLREVQGFGHVNTKEDSDGIKRRSPVALYYQGATYFHLGVVAAMDYLAGDMSRVRVDVEPEGPVRLRYADRDVEKVVSIPIDEKGLMLLNWAGDRNRPRGFKLIPFAAVYQIADLWNRLDKQIEKTSHQLKFRPYDQVQGAIQGILGNLEKCWKKLGPGVPSVEADAAKSEISKLQEELSKVKESLPNIEKTLLRNVEAQIKIGEQIVADESKSEEERAAALELVKKYRDGHRAIRELREEATRLTAELEPKIRGSICFLGTAATATGDLHAMPRAPTEPGVDIISNTTNTILTGGFIDQSPAGWNLAALICGGLLITAVSTFAPPTASVLFALAVLSGWLGASYYLFAAHNLLVRVVPPFVAKFLCYTGITTFRYFTEKKEKGKVRKLLEGRTSKEYVAEIMRNPDEVKPGGSKVEASVMFSDIRKFTTISEGMDPEELITYINQYHDPMTRIIMARGGFLDKYIGDGIMAVFGAPVKTKDHAAQVCLAALENCVAAKKLSAHMVAQNKPPIYIRVGIATGPMIAGEIGSAQRHEYSVMGDRVNLAARLEGANKAFNTQIMMAERTRTMAGDAIQARELGLIQVVGKEDPERVYELLGKKEDPSPLPEGFLEPYKEGLKRYQIGEFDKAVPAFEAALALRPNDGPTQVYLESCKEYLKNPPNPETWRGVIELHEK